MAFSSPVSHMRHEEYSYRVPTPPRIIVPPPSINVAVAPVFSLIPPKNHPVLSRMNYASMKTTLLMDWSYERRREAQAVLPFLYLGPMNAAKDRDFLQKEAITMMLNVRQKRGFEGKVVNAASRVAEELGIENVVISLSSDMELVAAFPSITQTINNHLLKMSETKKGRGKKAAGKILVFCESGNERSATVVAAYLMEVHEGFDHIKAMQLVQGQRFCVNFDDGMKRLLQSYWDILTAQRQVGAATGQWAQAVHAPAPVRASTKRMLDHDDDGSVAMEIDGDEERFVKRDFAPFVDLPHGGEYIKGKHGDP